MADNYVDVPVLCLKLLALGTCTTGGILEGSTIAGFQDATADTTGLGMIAMEAATAGEYFTAMVIGTAKFAAADSIKAGKGVEWSATGTIDSVADSSKKTLGLLLDGVAATDATRKYRVFIKGHPHHVGTW